MRVLGVTVLALGLLTATAGAAPVPGRGAALLKLQEAIEREQKALDAMRKKPPRYGIAAHHQWRAVTLLQEVRSFLSGVPGSNAAEQSVFDAWDEDYGAHIWEPRPFEDEEVVEKRDQDAIGRLERALAHKRKALPGVRNAGAPSAAPECGDGKDNDRDGTVDAKTDAGCSSARDARERSPFSCTLGQTRAGGRVNVSGSCSGAFAELEVSLLDSQLNGRYDVMHAPRCGEPEPKRFRCSTKDGEQNPKHLVDVRLTTSSTDPRQRVLLSLFDARKRLLGRFLAIAR